MMLRNRFGPHRVGRRQTDILRRMMENDGVFDGGWWMSSQDRESMNALERRGIIEPTHNYRNRFGWSITAEFQGEEILG